MNFNPFAENKIPSVSMFSKKFPEKKSIVASFEEVDTLDEKYGIKEYLGEKMNYEARKFFGELAAQIGENEARDFLPSSGSFSIISEEGELVITHLNREAMPMLRYRTRDLTRIIPEPCKCGRTHRRIERIKGRTDDMFIIGGVNVFPSLIETVLMNVPEVGNN